MVPHADPQIVPTRDCVESTFNVPGMFVLFLAMSRRSPDEPGFHRIDEASFSVGGSAFDADGGTVAPVLNPTPPVRVGAASFPATVEFATSSATLAYRRA